VDLYHLDLDDPRIDALALADSLSPDERVRAARFRLELHRRRFIIGRGVLRALLARITCRRPADLLIIDEANRKPAIAGGPAFNLSHSERHLLIGVASNGRLGVDVEVKRSVPDALDLAQRFFSPQEVAALAEVPPQQVSAAFLRLWTRKEALLKATGLGLSIPLDRFSVEIAEAAGNLLSSSHIDQIAPLHWDIRSVSVHEAIESAVAWDHAGFDICLKSLDPVGIAVHCQPVI
jgi:4'-phosphopantetheinyl transferase